MLAKSVDEFPDSSARRGMPRHSKVAEGIEQAFFAGLSFVDLHGRVLFGTSGKRIDEESVSAVA
jgi:hypothetical protein